MTQLRVIALFVAAAAAVASARVAVQNDPTHRVTFENAQLRIMDVNIPPGGASAEHRHAFDMATISMSDGAATRVISAGGAAATRPGRPMGDAVTDDYSGRPAVHRVENAGKAPVRLFAIENLKAGQWSTAAPASGRATTMTDESRAFRMYDVRLDRETQTSHRHEVPTIVVLVTGGIMSDGPDTHAKANAPAPVGLKQLTAPGEWLLVPAGDTHHVVRLGSREARVVEVEVR